MIAAAGGSAALDEALSPQLRARGVQVEYLAQVDSTNAELLRRGAAQADLSVLVADAQHAGRGRQGRVWQSPAGANLYLSLYRRFALAPRALGGLSLAVGIACAEALQALGADDTRLKWPNDLLARERKLGGILIELAPQAAVIGIGINVRMPVAAMRAVEQPWIDLAALGLDIPRAALVAALLDALLPALDAFERDGLAPFVARWRALDALAGRRVRVLGGDEVIEGEALGIADDGALRVATRDGERRFHSADVSLRSA